MINPALALFQLCDSNFPTGAFSHSYGLETYIQEGKVNNQATFSKWLDVYLNEQLVYADGLATRIIYQALEKNQLEEVWQLDRMLTVQNLPRETREGTQRIGERMLNLVESLYNVPVITQYQERIKKKLSYGHPAIVFTMIGHHLQVSGRETTLYYLYSNLTTLVQNAVRAIPLGQTAGQRTIQQFQPMLVKALEKIQGLKMDDFGIISPGLELSQMKHERVNIRIFMS
ncbi:urease accessory protein UreF [Oceanobacillus sp. 143]|uniref:Urease accessory protein UreF n=1 Tax=Oceanobacillus zhaokaii TaxID=2052660 RepID=A0A345PID1_9BACI|nr:urease accessory protein UreF [Oceanobacillus zhaokaii]AXI09761.1 urease accessory protein UreF [Oceanobacillus zhaokaii]QGS69058.1 urease accessory protein UreF [Oceanobacillus sp. 143]